MSDLAYTRILEILFERRLPAGAYVSQKELVEMTGVQVAPLRDALRVLDDRRSVAVAATFFPTADDPVKLIPRIASCFSSVAPTVAP